MRSAEYITTQPVAYGPFMDEKTLPEGSFVQPIEEKYIPKDTITSPKCAKFYPGSYKYCFTSAGIIPIPINAIRKVY